MNMLRSHVQPVGRKQLPYQLQTFGWPSPKSRDCLFPVVVRHCGSMPISDFDNYRALRAKIHERGRIALVQFFPDLLDTLAERRRDPRNTPEILMRELFAPTEVQLRPWADLLLSAFDVEVASIKVENSVRFLEADIQGSSRLKGEWIIHNFEHWVLQLDAFYDRVRKLIAQTYRRLVRPLRSWQILQSAIVAEVDAATKTLSSERNGLAHGLGGGVDGLVTGGYWPFHLAAHTPAAANEFYSLLLNAVFERVSSGWGMLGQDLKKYTRQVFAGIDELLGRIVVDIAAAESAQTT
jgi:hypothetical protein